MAHTDTQQLTLRLRQEAERALKRGQLSAGRFLAIGELPLARHAAHEAGVLVAFDGGWEGAERVQPCFYPDGDEPVFTFGWVKASWNARFASIAHSDLLGSLLALGLDRSCYGDLIALADHAWLAAVPEALRLLPTAWTSAGKTPLTVTVAEEPPQLEAPHGEPLRDTVPSLRLDCLVAAGMRLSRAKAAELICAGAVSVDHVEELRTDRLLAPGCLISVRRFGRIRFCAAGEPTRRDRIPVSLKLFRSGKPAGATEKMR